MLQPAKHEIMQVTVRNSDIILEIPSLISHVKGPL